MPNGHVEEFFLALMALGVGGIRKGWEDENAPPLGGRGRRNFVQVNGLWSSEKRCGWRYGRRETHARESELLSVI
jgi:hypothetical protein